MQLASVTAMERKREISDRTRRLPLGKKNEQK